MESEYTERPDSRHSWLVAAIGALAMIFTFGTPMSYGIMRQPVSDAFGISPVVLSVVFSIMLLSFYMGSGIVGVFGMRFPARALLMACSIVTGVLAPALYLTGSVVWLTVVFSLLGVSLGTTFVLVASIVPRWFDRRRSAAMGLIFVGNGFGMFVLPPIWQVGLSELGVRRGFLTIFAVTAVMFFLASLVCRRPRWVEQSTGTADELIEWLVRLSRTRRYQLLFGGIALSMAWYPLLAAYSVDLFTTRGLTATAASTAFGLVGGFSIISRIGGGYLGDRLGVRRMYLASLVCTATGALLLFVPLVWAIPAAVFLFGLGLGASVTLYIPLMLRFLPPEKDTAIVGISQIVIGIGALAMPPIGTASVSYTGSFTAAIALTVGLTVLAIWATAAGTAE